jgi:hypothetical protein
MILGNTKIFFQIMTQKMKIFKKNNSLKTNSQSCAFFVHEQPILFHSLIHFSPLLPNMNQSRHKIILLNPSGPKECYKPFRPLRFNYYCPYCGYYILLFMYFFPHIPIVPINNTISYLGCIFGVLVNFYCALLH